MILNEELYSWLVQSSIISQQDGVKQSEDRYQLSKSQQLNMENGVLFGKIAKHMSKIISKQQKRPESPLNLDTLKELNSPSAKIYNWNLLVQVFRNFNVTVDPDVKSLIVSGDNEMILELLKELYATTITWNPPLNQSSLINISQSQTNIKQQKGPQKEYKEAIDLTKLDPSKDPSKTKTCLEFLIITLSKHLELDPKQTASLFTHGNKYLAHVIAKGVKGLFDPIVGFYTEVYANINHLLKLFNDDPSRKSMQFALNALKPGLISKSYDVAEWTARLFSKLAFEFGDTNLLMHAWEWFIGDGSGLNTVLLSLKRHPDLRQLIVSTLLQFARFNFVELFTSHLRRALPDFKDLLNIQLQLLSPLMDNKTSREEILQTGILDDWIDHAFQVAMDDYRSSPDLKAVALTFLTEVWLVQPQKIEDQEYKANNLINLLSKATRDKSQALLYSSLNLQFKLLLHFGQDKNPYAPIIYKTLTLSLIEGNTNSLQREFMINNFITIFDKIDNIPMHIMLEPFIRQIQVSDSTTFSYNIFDFNFFSFVAKNDKLQIKNAIQLLDLLAKVYLNNIVFAQMSADPILNIIRRNIDNETMHEFVVKFIKISLAMYYASEKKKKPKEKILPLYNNRSALNKNQGGLLPQDLDNEILQAQKRSLIVGMVKNIVEFHSELLNEKIKPLVAHTNIQIKNFCGKQNNGMMSILSLFGDPDEVMVRYEEEYREHQSMLKEEEKQVLEQQEQNVLESIDKRQFSIADTRDETMMMIEANLNKYGVQNSIGYKNSKLTKQEMSRLALLRNPKANPKVLKQLDDIKQNFSAKQELEQKIKENNESFVEVQKKNLRKQLEKRSIEQGVSIMNEKDMTRVALYEYGSREKEIKREFRYLPDITYIDLKKEEERDKEMVQNMLKKYQKALKFLFLKYANTGFSVKDAHSNQRNFDDIKDKSNTISVSELWKFIKDFDFEKIENDKHFILHQLITPDENKTIVRLVNKEGMNQKDENQNLNFQGFLYYIINFSNFVCGKDPFNLGHLPLSYSIQFVIDKIRKETEKKKQSTILYDDPEGSYLGEQEVLKNYNFQLEQDPSYPLPEGYKKAKERLITFEYDITSKITTKPSTQLCYSILDSILKEIGIQQIEPKSKVREVTRAHPIINAGMDPKSKYPDIHKANKGYDMPQYPALQKIPKIEYKPFEEPPVNHSMFNEKGEFRKYMKERATQSAVSLHKILPGSTFDVVKPKYGKRRNLPIESFHQLSLGMKLSISSINYKDRHHAEECAYVLDDIIRAVEKDRKEIVKEGLFHPNNPIKNIKKASDQDKVGELNNKNKRHEDLRNQNMAYVDKLVEKRKPAKDEEEKKKKEDEEKLKNEQENKQKFREDWLKKQKDKAKLRVEEAKRKEEEEEHKRQEKEKVEKQEFNKKFKEFNETEKQKFKDKFNKIEEERKKYEEDERKKIQQEKIKSEKLYRTICQDEQKRLTYQRENDEKIAKKHQEFAEVYKQQEKKLRSIFKLLSRYTDKKLVEPALKNSISLKTFMWFCHQFNIYPEIIHSIDAILIFRSITKNKNRHPLNLPEKQRKEIEEQEEDEIAEDQMTEEQKQEKQERDQEKARKREVQQQKQQLKDQEKQIELEKQKEIEKKKGNQQIILVKSGGFIPVGLNYREFEMALTRLAIKGKKQYNKFAERLKSDGKLNQSTMDNMLNGQNEAGKEDHKDDGDKSVNMDGIQNEDDEIAKYKLVVDDYGQVDLAYPATLECLIYYLGFPEDNMGIEERFRLAMEKNQNGVGGSNLKSKKNELRNKYDQDPKSFIIERTDPNKSMVNKSAMLNKSIMDQQSANTKLAVIKEEEKLQKPKQ